MLDEEDVLVIDTRNDYETAIGMFEKRSIRAQDIPEFPEYVRTADIPKTKKVMIYCTGGIRCEGRPRSSCSAGLRKSMSSAFGGILKYLEEGKGRFNGECASCSITAWR